VVALAWREVGTEAPRATIAPVSVQAGSLTASAPSFAAGATSTSQLPVISRAVQAFDPAIADRLVDDVIRRVDRRMRINRERRGL
jgi:hypothetical protein